MVHRRNCRTIILKKDSYMYKKVEIINPKNYEIYRQKARKASFISNKEHYMPVEANKIEYPKLKKLKEKLGYDEIIKYKQDLLFKKEYKQQKTVAKR